MSNITIGNQVWMVENLNVEFFQNGDAIPEAQTEKEWYRAFENNEPAWCYYDNNPMNGDKYGKLYNWFAVIDNRGLCPEGWHIPTKVDWDFLMEFLGGENIAGGKLKSVSGWDDEQHSEVSTNESGFTALPGGCRSPSISGLVFSGLERIGYWWSATKGYHNLAFYPFLIHNFIGPGGNDGRVFYMNDGGENCGFSVRCVRD